MKPIKLKIKGLNSFIEEQTIDFIRLTDKGLFGIFGPTGSGKSTILDGITLALYGEISRKSTNFINTNCDALQINYEFQISASEVKKYSVYREFKRDKKTGNSISGKCKIVDISGDEPIILAEKVREVNEKCKEIIGLGIDDFLRTVVLPQGKFSEFLKLEGKSRREMLERLFNLEKYGDDLSNKLGKEISKNRTLNNQLIGEMKGYEDISKEKLVEKEKEYNNLVNVYEETNKKYLDVEEQFTEIKEIYDLNVELKEYLNEAKLIKDNEDEIKKCKEKLHLGESALKVNPFILSLESTREELKSTNSHKEKLIIEIDEVKEESKKIEESFIKAKDKKENELPILKLREERAKNALEEKKLIDEINIELSKIVKLKNTLNSQKEEFEENFKKINLNINSVNDIIKKNEEEIESLNIDSCIKEGVQQGILLNSQYTEYKNRFDRNNEKRKELINKYNSYKEIINITNEKLIIKTNLLEEKNQIRNKLINENPGNEEDLLKLQEELNNSKQKWESFNKLNEDIKFNNERIEELEKEISLKKKENEKYKEDFMVINEKKKKEEINYFADKIREQLSEGDTCPVCGSKHISKITYHNSNENIESLENELKEMEELIKNLEKDITILIVQNNGLKEKNESSSNEILKLGEEFKERNPLEIEGKIKTLLNNLNLYNKNKVEVEEEIVKIKDEKSNLENELNKVNAISEENNNRLKEIEDDTSNIKEKLDKIRENIQVIEVSINVRDFEKKNEEIILAEKKKNSLLNNQKTLRSKLDIYLSEKEELQKEINILRERLVKGDSIQKEKEELKKEKEKIIYDKIGEVHNISELIIDISKDIKCIEENYNKLDKEKNEIDEKYNYCNEKVIEINSKINEFINIEKDQTIKLNLALKEEGFANISEVRETLISKEEINNLKSFIEDYNNKVSKVKGAIESLEKKINNRSVSDEKYNEVMNIKNTLKEKVKEISEDKIKKGEEVNFLKKKISELDKLLIKRDEIEHKLALLNDLEKLFKGKKFIEFVAINRLKYISREASKRLQEITNGNYSLEVDENGKFIIRDYKNGGVERDASTLSGGETFLASLSLALALSAEIQLKGIAPLELFFLDEGFGTLDDNLLEVVMSSLERVHNDKLKVGIISHVESIKNRVPVKLIITPAESGMGGSKVRIETT